MTTRERQLCAAPMCDAIARRSIMGYKWCEPCAAGVEQATYMGSLSADAAERLKYRQTFTDALPKGVSPFEPLTSLPPKSGWRSRR